MRLDDWLQSKRSVADHLAVIESFCVALNEAHAQGTVHPALEPSNIEIASNGACDLEPATSGTAPPRYRAPEMAEGAAPSPQADIYAAGVVFYEMLSGRSPSGERPTPLADLRPDVPRDLTDAVMGCLERGPDWRPKDLSYLLQVVTTQRAASGGRSASRAPAPRAAETSRPSASRSSSPRRAAGSGGSRSSSNTPLIMAALVLLVGAGAGGWWYLSRGKGDDTRRVATAPTPTPPPPTEAPVTPQTIPVATPRPTPTPRATPTPGTAPPTPEPTPIRVVAAATPPPTPLPVTPATVAPIRVTPPPPTTLAPVVTAPAAPASLTAVSPLTVKRPGTAMLDVRGENLRADHTARVLRVKEPPNGITVVRQKWVDRGLLRVLINVDATAAPGAYAIAVADNTGESNTVTFTVTK
jgi:serine/threonine-protein kinase